MTSHLASNAATLKAEGRKDRQIGNRGEEGRAPGEAVQVVQEGQRTRTREVGGPASPGWPIGGRK